MGLLRVKVNNQWRAVSGIVGPTGPQGIQGPTGPSGSDADVTQHETQYNHANFAIASNVVAKSGDTMSGSLGMGYNQINNPLIRSYREGAQDTLNGNLIFFNFGTGVSTASRNFLSSDRVGAVTVSYSNIPTDSDVMVPLTFRAGSTVTSITWPSGTRFPGGDPPELDGETWFTVVAYKGVVTVGRAWAGVV